MTATNFLEMRLKWIIYWNDIYKYTYTLPNLVVKKREKKGRLRGSIYFEYYFDYLTYCIDPIYRKLAEKDIDENSDVKTIKESISCEDIIEEVNKDFEKDYGITFEKSEAKELFDDVVEWYVYWYGIIMIEGVELE